VTTQQELDDAITETVRRLDGIDISAEREIGRAQAAVKRNRRLADLARVYASMVKAARLGDPEAAAKAQMLGTLLKVRREAEREAAGCDEQEARVFGRWLDGFDQAAADIVGTLRTRSAAYTAWLFGFTPTAWEIEHDPWVMGRWAAFAAANLANDE